MAYSDGSHNVENAIIVLGTTRPDGTLEYRTARYSSMPRPNHGICEHEVIRDPSSPLHLRQTVARGMFDNSPVYQSREQAVQQAELIPKNTGVKVIQLTTPYPNK